MLTLVAGVHGSWAAESPAPPAARRIILTVTGEVGEAAGKGGAVDFTLDELERLGTVELVTTTPFTQGSVRFTGVQLQRVLEVVKARGSVVRATALNDYAVDIPREDATTHGAVLATRVDGKPLPIRDKGPLWIVYPWSGRPELEVPVYGSRSIWQLRSLELR